MLKTPLWKLLPVMICLTASCMTPPPAEGQANHIRVAKAYGRNYVYLEDVAKYYGMSLVKAHPECELRSRFSRIIFTPEKRSAVFNGFKINLLYSPFLHKGEPMISQTDFSLVLDPMLRKAALPQQRVRKIMLDPGHGGKDHGATGKLYREKDLVIQISRRLRSILTASGFEVVMTRDGDTFLSLQERADLCARNSPDIFISIHCNAVATESVKGIETFCIPPAGAPSTSENNAPDTQEKGNLHDKSNARLALEVQRHTLLATGAQDRGVKHARFSVLKNASSPAVLVETGFLSNTAEERLLGSTAYQKKIAEGIAKAIAAYAEAVKP